MAENKAEVPSVSLTSGSFKNYIAPIPHVSSSLQLIKARMKSDYLLLSILPSLASSQTIPQILSLHSQLSSLSSYVNSFPSFAQQLKTADNFTFLAPTNDAFSTWLAGNRSRDYIEATLTYHLLNGTYPSVELTATPLFIPSALTNKSYCNVTGGQRVKAFNDGNAVFGSALETNSTVVTAVSENSRSFKEVLMPD